jgi:adenylate kinase
VSDRDVPSGPRFARGGSAVTRLLLLAPPGGGKGTQGARLRERLGVEHIAAGDLLRGEMQSGSDAGRRAAATVERGELVPDELILELLKPALLAAARHGGFILDGFPRTVSQAEALEALGKRDAIPLQAVVSLTVPEAELQRRLLARAGIEGRSDDTPAVIARRLQLFATDTRPLLDFYADRGLLVRIDGDQDPDGITAEILDRLQPAVRTSGT